MYLNAKTGLCGTPYNTRYPNYFTRIRPVQILLVPGPPGTRKTITRIRPVPGFLVPDTSLDLCIMNVIEKNYVIALDANPIFKVTDILACLGIYFLRENNSTY